MNKELLKLEPVFNRPCTHLKYEIRSSGWGKHTPPFTITCNMEEISDLDLVLISHLDFLGSGGIGNSPIKKYLPYLYDDDYLGIIDRDWDHFQIMINVYNEDGSYMLMTPPPFEKLFDSTEEFEQYLKEEFDKMERYSDEEGEMLQPWELDEAKEVLEQDGWSKLELERLIWVGKCRGFGAPLNSDAMFLGRALDDVIKNHPDFCSKADHYIKCIKNLIKLAHDVERSIGFNGPEGFGGVYIYRVPEDIEIPEYADSVIMPDGRRYILHEGD